MAAARDLLQPLVAQRENPTVQRLASFHVIQLFFIGDFRQAVAALEPYVQTGSKDADALAHYAFACFALEDMAESIRASREALMLRPQDVATFKTLGMASLVDAQLLDAFMAFSAAQLVQPNGGFDVFRTLAMRLMQGQSVVEFNFDGERYRFNLRVDNGQMLEAASHHARGMLTEQDELRMIREKVSSSGVLIEVGTLVGNHLVYFLRTLKPRKAIVFDISPRSIEASAANVRLNEPYSTTPELDFRPLGIAAASDTIVGPDGNPAQVTSIDEAVADEVDFMKIDVDGLEIEALNGARRLIERARPRIMIEIAREHDAAFQVLLNELRYLVIGHIDRGLHRNYLVAAR